jgi:hypothetical protein
MPSADEKKPTLISFPKAAKGLTDSEKAMLAQQSAKIHELINGTNMALSELCTGALNVFFDLTETMNLDTWTLCEVLDVCPSQARDLMAKETDDLTTETILLYLERLRA